jgi:hypothetical protein
MSRTRQVLAVCAILLGLAGLVRWWKYSPSTVETKQANPAASAVPPEMQQAAEALLGSEAEVVVFGDLAHNGQQQVLVVNRLKATPTGVAPGILLTRAVIAEKDGATWKEVLGCDEHLKNIRGFLAATPLAPVTSWRLQHEQNADKGLMLYFTPLAQPAGGYIQTIGVRWNPAVKRYQSLDRTYEHFLGETPSLESPEMRLQR